MYILPVSIQEIWRMKDIRLRLLGTELPGGIKVVGDKPPSYMNNFAGKPQANVSSGGSNGHRKETITEIKAVTEVLFGTPSTRKQAQG